ncbi:unnamed protein product [Ambrosiozyma monospora]|uniref:Unnamed protein product n=1 Tax=Ambrosiozyma monospora TaxID=43982 RepID=A0ACB5TBT1_AMBMO|nr:unnamed protein product [Ambrosiozyma monospora]
MPEKIEDQTSLTDRAQVVLDDGPAYATKLISILSKAGHKDIVRFALVSLIDASVFTGSELPGYVLSTSQIDSSLPYLPLSKLLGSDDEVIRYLSAYILTILLTNDKDSHKNYDALLLSLFDLLSVDLLSNSEVSVQYIGIQLLKELLTIKEYRTLYWEYEAKYFPNLLKVFKDFKGELQMKYQTILAVWLLTFSKKSITDINNKYPELIGALYKVAKDAVKEKIVRLAIGALVNLLNIDSNKELVVKQYLLCNGLETTKQLIDRKWADEELKSDLNILLETLNEAVSILTTFDEYENELKTKKLVWSPPHKSDEFWYENLDRFKENNWKLLKELVSLLDLPVIDQEQSYQNEAIVCFDVSQLIKVAPESAKALNKIGGKARIMSLMTSPNSNVKFEALRTTQQLVAHTL